MPIPVERRSRTRLAALLACLAGACLLAAGVGAIALAQPSDPTTEPRTVEVELSQRDLSVDPEGSFRFVVDAELSTDTAYFESRLRIYNPGGSLLYQKTEVRNDAAGGVLSVTYERDLADLSLAEGAYPVELRVLSTDNEALFVEDRMLVVDDEREPVRVAVVARFSCTPARDAENRFVVDPAQMEADRDRTLDVMRLARDETPLALALPPVLLDDWRRASRGYDRVGAEGVVEIPEADPVAQGYATALDAFRRLAARPSLEILTVPYAEPDLQGLQAMVALEDLDAHLTRSYESLATLEATPVPGFAIAGDALPASALDTLEASGLEFILLGPGAIASDATATPGAHAIAGSELTAIVLDERASAALDKEQPSAGLVDAAFEAALDDDGRPMVAQLALGPGADGTVEGLSAALAALRDVPWIELVPLSAVAADVEPDQVSLSEQSDQGAPAPVGYWAEVLEARRLAAALEAAAGPHDPDVTRAMNAVLLAESRCWAGPDGGWGLADRGRAFAAAAVREAEEVLATISVSSEDLTLAGQEGKVPLNIANGSSKTLTVTVSATGQSATIGPPSSMEYALRPSDNYLTLPIRMTSALSDRVHVQVLAGDEVVASTYVRVRASYLDRLAIIGSVILVLAVLLFYIRRRVMT